MPSNRLHDEYASQIICNVAVFDSVVHHLDEVTRSATSDPLQQGAPSSPLLRWLGDSFTNADASGCRRHEWPVRAGHPLAAADPVPM